MNEIRLNQIAQVIYDKKGANIIALDVHEISSLTDYFIFAEGNVERHVIAIAQAIIQDQLEKGHKICHVEGTQKGDWIVLDYGYIMIHLFHPDIRERYALEKLWKYGSIIDLNIIVNDTSKRV